MEIKHYIDEDKKQDGYAYCCAYVECETEDLNIEVREKTFEEADKIIIERLKRLSNEISTMLK